MTVTDEITFVDIPLPGAITPPPAPDSTDGGGASTTSPGDSTPTEDAPYGRKADGSPREKPGRKPTSGAPKSSGRPGRRAPRPAAAPRPTAAKKAAGPDYEGAIMGLFQLPMAGLAFAGLKDESFLADSITLELYAPPLAQALAALARENAGVAAALDRLMQVGPYGGIIAAILPMVLQLLANHSVIKPGMMGTHTVEELATVAGMK